MSKPTYDILIACYKSVQRLDKLVSSLALLDKSRFKLHFSIDYSSKQSEVAEAIEELKDVFNIGLIIARDENLGLQAHITECIGILAGFDQGGVLLEDDLFVDKSLIEYLDEYVPYIEGDDSISSLGLYHQHYFHYSALPFLPYEQGPYLLEYPCSWGLHMSAKEAIELYNFLIEGTYNENSVVVPSNVLKWNNSWKKHYCIYLTLHSKSVMYSQRSVVTNTGVEGVHMTRSSNFYQSPMGYNAGISKLKPAAGLLNRYDVFMEPNPSLLKHIQPELNLYDFDVDLEGDRSLKFMRKKYLISSKPCSNPIIQFGDELRPLLHNLRYPKEGGIISFGLTKDFSNSPEKTYVRRFESLLPPLSKKLLLKLLWRNIWKK